MSESSNVVPFPHMGTSAWIEGYQQDCLDVRCDEATVDAHLRILRQFTAWVAKLPGQGGQFVLYVRHKGEKFRDIDVLNEARHSLYDYLQHGRRERISLYVFTSKPGPQLIEDGIHQWFQSLKRQANHEEWELIADLSCA
jgi:hypothetical protein